MKNFGKGVVQAVNMIDFNQRTIGERLMLIGGRRAPAQSGATMSIRDPGTGETIGSAPRGAAEDVDVAVDAARRAFMDGPWARTSAADRARIMSRYADLVEQHAEELAFLESLNSGMLYGMALHMVGEVVSYLRYYEGWATKIHGVTSEISNAQTGEFHAYTLKQPIGVCGFVTPWNFPMSIAMIKIAPALAAGCTCVLKPSEETPFSSLRLAELALEAGLPEGVLNVVTGYGIEAGAAIAAHPGIAKVAFTGSTIVGKEIVKAAAGNLKRVTLELGGKSPVVVFDDCDLDAAIQGVATGIFVRSGQVCVAGSRLYVQRKSFDKVVEGVAAIASSMKIGDQFASDTQIGPIISDKQLQRVRSLVETGPGDGAEIVTGGRAVSGAGFYYEPTVLANPNPDARVVREEIFGPVLCASPFDDIEDIARIANSTEYGLASAIWSRDAGKIHKMAKRIDAGVVWANCAFVTDTSLPIAGHKQSGWGGELGREGLDPYLSTKSVFVKLD
ncbi:aldehyde dehydrogenase [Sphingobium sp. EM0848]|uniref:aldehyde dehydrogenase family protein n=1 Tax=Sphingobium sp. EM0848 TaxID=2743473 RepID=UPI00210082F2|nr:aldehyde dehydrogenase family protein [Sphingobium sp. EM0848]